MSEFFNMGGYAGFVWPAFGISLVVLAANVFYAKNQLKRITRETARRSAAVSRNKKTARPMPESSSEHTSENNKK